MNSMKVLLSLIACWQIGLAALLGVDFGQDFLKSTLIAPGIPFEIVLTLETKRKEPSAIALKSLNENEFERFYGHSSGPICSRFPDTCVTGLKALLGQPYDNSTLVQLYSENHPGVSPVVNEKRGTMNLKFKSSLYSVEEISAMILSHIKDRAQKMLKAETGSSYLSDIVLTVPSYFTISQRAALIDSAKIAGFVNVKLVDDGVAVAVNYASNNIKFDLKPTQYHIIYDMGASSAKATLLKFHKNESGISIETKGYAFDLSLGGESFTKSILNILKAKFLAANPSVKEESFTSNKKSMVKLWQSAEKTKLILSANNEASASVESLYGDIDFKASVTREEFEEANAEAAARFTAPIMEAINNNIGGTAEKFAIEDIDSIILFGGSTRVPMVQKAISQVGDGTLISKNVNSDEAAVQGATLRGVIMTKMFRAKDIDVIEHSIFDYNIEYKAGDKSYKMPVFPKSSLLKSIVAIPLEKLTDMDNFELAMYENGNLFETNSYKSVSSDISRVAEKLTDFETCKKKNGLKYTAFFEMNSNRVVSIKNVTVSCGEDKEGGFFGNLWKNSGSDNQIPLVNNTEGSNTTETQKVKTFTCLLTPSKNYPFVKPLGPLQKDSSERKLKDLAYKDQIRAQKTELMNSLESELYSLRSSIDDIIDEIESSTSKLFTSKDLKTINAFKSLISENLEWLEDQSYGANLKNLKTSTIGKKIDTLNVIDDYLRNPTRMGKFVDLSTKATKIIDELKKVSGSVDEESRRLQGLYSGNRFTREAFDKDYAKVLKTSVLKIEELNLEKEILGLTEQLEELNKVVLGMEDSEDEEENEEVKRIVKSYELYSQVVKKVDGLAKMIAKLDKEHKRRSKQIEKSLDMRIKRRKEKIAKAESAALSGSSDPDSASTAFASTVSDSSASTASSTDSEAIHDEL